MLHTVTLTLSGAPRWQNTGSAAQRTLTTEINNYWIECKLGISYTTTSRMTRLGGLGESGVDTPLSDPLLPPLLLAGKYGGGGTRGRCITPSDNNIVNTNVVPQQPKKIKVKEVESFMCHAVRKVALISIFSAFNQTPNEAAGPWTRGDTASHGAPVHLPAYAATYSLVTTGKCM